MKVQMTVMDQVSGATKMMQNANNAIPTAQVATDMKNFQKEQMKMEMKQDMMGDLMDVGPEGDQEADDVYNQICGEIGLGVQGANVGMGAIPGQQNAIGNQQV